MSSANASIIPASRIMDRIFVLRGQKVMLDKDLAELYGVEVKQLKRAVKRNISRFPSDFMFILTKDEDEILRRQIGTSSWGGARYLPFVFTEHGVAMLSSVLNSERAIQVNIQIIRTFTRLKELLATHEELRLKLESLEKKYDEQFKVVFDAFHRLLDAEAEDKPQIGFKVE